MKAKVSSQLLLGIIITLAVIILSSGSALAEDVSDQTGLESALIGSDSTITLTDGFILTKDITISRDVTLTGGAVTLNTDEYSLVVASGSHLTVDGELTIRGNGGQIILVKGGGTFTLNNGTIENTFAGYEKRCAIAIENGGTVNVNGGTVKSNCVSAAGAINTDDGIVTLNITGGNIQANIRAINLVKLNSQGPKNTVNISDSVISSNNTAITIYYGDITISGVEINAPTPIEFYDSSAEISNAISNGGPYLQGCKDVGFTNCTFGGINVPDSIDSITFTGGTFHGENTLNGCGGVNITGGTFNGDNSLNYCGEVNITDCTFIGSGTDDNGKDIVKGLTLNNTDKAVIGGDTIITGTEIGIYMYKSTIEIECSENLEIFGANSIIYDYPSSVLNSLPKPIIMGVDESETVDIAVATAEFTFDLDTAKTSDELVASVNGENSFSMNPITAGDYSLFLAGTKTGETSSFLSV